MKDVSRLFLCLLAFRVGFYFSELVRNSFLHFAPLSPQKHKLCLDIERWTKPPQRNIFKCDMPRTINKTLQNWEVNLLQCNRNNV